MLPDNLEFVLRHFCLLILAWSILAPAVAQHDMSDMQNMPGMKSTNRGTFIETEMHHGASGTGAEPATVPAPMLMTMHGGWMVMLHGQAFVANEQQSGPRGA